MLDPIEEFWASQGPPEEYPRRHAGVRRGADELLARDGRMLAAAMSDDALPDTTSAGDRQGPDRGPPCAGGPATGHVLTLIVVADGARRRARGAGRVPHRS